jgi:hypothetical protein
MQTVARDQGILITEITETKKIGFVILFMSPLNLEFGSLLPPGLG